MRDAVDLAWLDVLHILDSGFPTGAFVHSFGLESLPHARGDLERVLRLRLDQTLARLELVFVCHAYTHDLTDLDERLDTLLLMRETREGSAAVGTHLLRTALELLCNPRLEAFQSTGRHYHHAVAFGGVAQALGLTRRAAAEAYALGSLRGQISAAQRLGWLGQRAAQRVLHNLKPDVRSAAERALTLELDDASSFAPAWDLAAMAHERADARMFA